MNKELMLFINEKFGNVRMVKVDGKPYAVANDVAVALGYKKPNNAINTHCKHATLYQGSDSLGRSNSYNIIPEGDIIRLAVKCPLDGADEFESWIFDEVIPSVLNDGGYINSNTTSEQVRKLNSKWAKKSIYLTKEIHDRKSLRDYIRNSDKMQLEETTNKLVDIVEPMKGSIKHDLIDTAIKELSAIDAGLLKDTPKHTYIKDVAVQGIVTLQDIKIGKYKKRISLLEQVLQ